MYSQSLGRCIMDFLMIHIMKKGFYIHNSIIEIDFTKFKDDCIEYQLHFQVITYHIFHHYFDAIFRIFNET